MTVVDRGHPWYTIYDHITPMASIIFKQRSLSLSALIGRHSASRDSISVSHTFMVSWASLSTK